MSAKKIIFLLFFAFAGVLVFAQGVGSNGVASTKTYYVLIETEFGNMRIQLYNETPRHRDNFLKLVREGFYDSLLFHRVINEFMIQGGDPRSKNAKPGAPLGMSNLTYTVPAEFVPSLYHRKGALAAARQGDNVNPKKESSASQFYLVQGYVWDEETFARMETQTHKTFSPEARKVYTTEGGTPFLDGDYTVFGQVVEGLEVIDKIAAQPVDQRARPYKDIRMKITVIE